MSTVSHAKSTHFAATVAHISLVSRFIFRAANNLGLRALNHDKSKLESPEVEVYEEHTPKLAGLTYGSHEYWAQLAQLKPALDHHYKTNDHHPEFFPVSADPELEAIERAYEDIKWYSSDTTKFVRPILAADIASRKSPMREMNLVQLLEMLCDWKAASMRHDNGDIRASIEINQNRFGYSDELKRILLNTLPVIEEKA